MSADAASHGRSVVNAMTIDVEDYFHVSAFDGVVPRADWDRLESRVVRQHRAAARHLRRVRACASTFFVLGWVAERHPGLVRAIAARGHEVASHGYAHRLVYDQTPAAFRDDVRRAKALLEDAAGRPVRGYRAPSYSITPRSLWALDVLIEEGYRYDSSIFPIRHDRYGIPVSAAASRTRSTGRPARSSRCPASTTRLGPLNLPVAGGGYFRLLPYCVDALGHRARQSRASGGRRSSTCTRGRSIRTSRAWSPVASEPLPALPEPAGHGVAAATIAQRLPFRPGGKAGRRRAHEHPRTRAGRAVTAVFMVTPLLAAPAATPALDTGPVSVTHDIDAIAWNEYVHSHADATVDHLFEWRDIFTSVFGHDCTYLAAVRDGCVVGVLPLVKFRSRLFGRFVVSLPFLNYGGLLTSDAPAATALTVRAKELTRAFGGTHLELRHVDRQCTDLPFRSHKLALTRALPQSADTLWTTLDKKVRNQIRKAQKEGLVAVEGGAALVDDFYRVFAENMRDLGTPVYSRRLFVEVLRRFPEQARVTVVRCEGRPVAASVVMHWRGVVLVPWASSLKHYRQRCPNMLLYWSMMESAIAAGAQQFDFGRSSPGSGTHAFKLQWGATERPLHWEYALLSRDAPPDQGPTNAEV